MLAADVASPAHFRHADRQGVSSAWAVLSLLIPGGANHAQFQAHRQLLHSCSLFCICQLPSTGLHGNCHAGGLRGAAVMAAMQARGKEGSRVARSAETAGVRPGCHVCR